MTGMNSRSRAALPLAIFGGFALIAIAIVFVFRWETVPSSRGVAAFRLDRWTGKITFCRYSATFEMDCSEDPWGAIPDAKAVPPDAAPTPVAPGNLPRQ